MTLASHTLDFSPTPCDPQTLFPVSSTAPSLLGQILIQNMSKSFLS